MFFIAVLGVAIGALIVTLGTLLVISAIEQTNKDGKDGI